MLPFEYDFYRDIDDNECVEVTVWRYGHRVTAYPIRVYGHIMQAAQQAGVYARIGLGCSWDYLGRGASRSCSRSLRARLGGAESFDVQLRAILEDAWVFEPDPEAVKRLRVVQSRVEQIQGYRGYRRRCKRYRRAGLVQDRFLVTPERFEMAFADDGSTGRGELCFNYVELERDSVLRYVPDLDLNAVVAAMRALWKYKKKTLGDVKLLPVALSKQSEHDVCDTSGA